MQPYDPNYQNQEMKMQDTSARKRSNNEAFDVVFSIHGSAHNRSVLGISISC